MRPSRQAAVLTLSLLLPSIFAITLDCDHVRAKDVKWNLNPLKGPHYVFLIDKNTGTDGVRNVSFALDLCQPLKKTTYNDCEPGTRVCAQERTFEKDAKEEPQPHEQWSIAGEMLKSGGKLDATVERLRGSSSSQDAKSEGVRIQLQGGSRGAKKTPQKLVATMICDHDRTGLEGEGDKSKRKRADEDDNNDDDDDDGDNSGERPEQESPNKSITLESYGDEPGDGKSDIIGVLRIQWRTKYACEDQAEKEEPKKGSEGGSHWGFFTWFIIVLFLGVAAYLIFGSWLNYSRHGARGWDLVPHGDTIRDMPYLMKDWGRRVVSTVQGGGSRGGYSAVWSPCILRS